MASSVRSVRLRIPSYTTIPEGSGGTAGKDIIFALKANRVQKNLTDGAKVLVYYGRNSNTLSFEIMKFAITVTGVLTDEPGSSSSDPLPIHANHPLTTAVEHVPDFIDMEEAAVLWNNATTPDGNANLMPQLEIEQGRNGTFRVYKGLIREMTLTKYAGKIAADFSLMFDVVWSDETPTLREWA